MTTTATYDPLHSAHGVVWDVDQSNFFVTLDTARRLRSVLMTRKPDDTGDMWFDFVDLHGVRYLLRYDQITTVAVVDDDAITRQAEVRRLRDIDRLLTNGE